MKKFLAILASAFLIATPVLAYSVKSGDSLSKIAKANHTTVLQLATSNGIKNPNLIHVGQQITIENSTGQVLGATPGEIGRAHV